MLTLVVVAYVVHIGTSLPPVVVAVDDVDNASVARHNQVVVAVVDIHLVVVAYVALVVDVMSFIVDGGAVVVVAVVVVVVALVH